MQGRMPLKSLRRDIAAARAGRAHRARIPRYADRSANESEERAMSVRLVVIAALALVASGALAQPLPPGQQPSAPPRAALANPASVNCEKLGGRHVIRNLPRGQVGMCVFKDGRVCDEWALYRDDRCVGGVGARRASQSD
jgi:putative hemolysin